MENRIFLERYRLSLGRNGLPIEMHRAPAARTFRGHEVETGREIALTIVSPAPSDPELLEKLESEAVAAEKINHINIPRFYDFGRENDELIYVSEYCEGHTASAWVEARGPLTIAAVLRVALQVADAMNATVFQRLCHPALNPDNILFVAGQTGEGDWPPVKVLHWYGPPPALAEPADARVESAARFAAPEQLNEGKVDVRSEIYSLGATMWFLLTGVSPAVEGPGGLGAATSKLRGVPKIVRHLLERMVRSNPLERPHDPVALASYLQTCLGRVERRAKMERRIGIPLLSQARVAAPRTPMPGKRLAGVLAVLVVAMLAILFLTQSLISRPSPQLTARTSRVSATAPGELVRPNEPTLAGEPAAGEQESSDKTAASRTSLPPAEVAAAPQAPRGELISIAPSPATVSSSDTSQTDALLGDELTTNESSPTASEPPAPEEGPSEKNDALVANDPEIAPLENSSPNESTSAATVAPPLVTESNEPHPGAVVPTPAQVADLAPTLEAKAEPTDTPTAALRKNLLAKDVATKSKANPPHDSSHTHVAKKRDRRTRTVKRAQPLPRLRVGSAPAEFVGTTRNGNWILSVDATGETIIVPPPPGYRP